MNKSNHIYPHSSDVGGWTFVVVVVFVSFFPTLTGCLSKHILEQ